MSGHIAPYWTECLCSECGKQAACGFPGNCPACAKFEDGDQNAA